MRLISRAAMALGLGGLIFGAVPAHAESVLLYFDSSEVLQTTLNVPLVDMDTQNFTLSGFVRAEVEIVPHATFGARISSFRFNDVTAGNVNQSDIDFTIANVNFATDVQAQSRNIVQKYLSNANEVGTATANNAGTIAFTSSGSSLTEGSLRLVGTLLGQPYDETAPIEPAWVTTAFTPGTVGSYTLTPLGGGQYDIALSIPVTGEAVIDPNTGTTLALNGTLEMSTTGGAPIPILPALGYFALIAGLGFGAMRYQRSSRSGLDG